MAQRYTDVKIGMRSVLTDVETSEKTCIKHSLRGKFEESNGAFSFIFGVPEDDGALPKEISVHVNDSTATVTEKGDAVCKMTIDGEKRSTDYTTPLGKFILETENGKVKTVKNGSVLTVFLSYTATLQGLDRQDVKIRFDIEKEAFRHDR